MRLLIARGYQLKLIASMVLIITPKEEEKMKKYEVTIYETLSRSVEIEAKDVDEAREKVRNMYIDEEIVLDSSDYVDTEFEVETICE